jgi:ankyrin repeat protein
MKTGYRDLNSEAFGESSSLLDKKDESATFYSLPAGGTQNNPLREERIQVSVDHTGETSIQNITQIFNLVERGDYKAISNLSTSDATYVCTIDREGSTALHRAVSLACQDGEWEPDLYQCINVLMNCEQLNVNMPNKEGYTAIGLAVYHRNMTCVEHMLKHPSAGRLYLDYYPGDKESTVREIIMETFPDLRPFLPAPLMESLDSSHSDKKLLAALQHDKYYTFKDNLDSINPNPYYGEPYHSSLLEIACQMKNRKQFVKILLDNGADPNIKNRVTGMPLIHATARCGNFEVLQLLLEKEGEENLEDNEQRTVLHWLAGVSETKSKKRLENCLNLLLNPDCSWKVDIEIRDRWGNTPLYIAVERGFRDRAKLLLSKGADFRVFERGSKILLSDSVSIVNEILDDCLHSNDKPLNSIDLQLELKYQSLNNIVLRIAESKFHSDLLTHPVMSSFLILKWENLRFVFLSDVAFYLAFLFFLTVYILYSEPNKLSDGGAANNTTDPFSFNDTSLTSGMNESNVLPQPQRTDQFFLWLCLMVLLILLTLREIVQLFVHRWFYIQSPENWLQILLIIATFISCSGVADGMEIELHSSAFALLLGWSELLVLSGRLPLLSIQQKMFKRVSRTFLWYMMGYFPLLIAFALSFYILFRVSAGPYGNKHFRNPLLSLSKTIIMFSGELDASNLSFETWEFTSHVIFLLFVVLVAIILLNLLNGLAVNDTEEITKVAQTLSLESRVRLLSRIEGLVNALPKCIKPDVELKKEMFVIYPNRWNRNGSAAVQSLLSIISEKTRPEGKDKSTAFRKEWRMFAEKLCELQILHDKLQKKFESMLCE